MQNGRNGFAGHEHHDSEDRQALKRLQEEAKERLANPQAYLPLFREIYTRIHDPKKLRAAQRSPSG